MSQDQSWRNNEPRIRTREEPPPTPQPAQTKKALGVGEFAIFFVLAMMCSAAVVFLGFKEPLLDDARCYGAGNNIETEVPLPQNRPALTLKEFEARYGCWMIAAWFDEANVIHVRKWEWNESRKGCDFTSTNPRLTPEDYKALKAEAMRDDERVTYSVEDACARVLKKRFPETSEQK